MDTTRKAAFVALFVAVPALLVFAADRERVGIVAPYVGILLDRPLQVGDPAPDFTFIGEDGKPVKWSKIRGDVTILGMVATAYPNICLQAGEIANLADQYSTPAIDVRFVCISEPRKGACDLQTNIVRSCSLPSMRVIGLCDANSEVRSVFGAKGGGMYYVIGRDGNIAAMGQLDDLHGMQEAVAKAVSEREPSYVDDWSETPD